METIWFQFWDKSYPYFLEWVYDITSINIGDIIVVKNDKQKINGYIEKLSVSIIGCLTNHSRCLMEYNDFVRFAKETIDWKKYTKKSFNSIPYFKFKILNIYKNDGNENILVVQPCNIENDRF